MAFTSGFFNSLKGDRKYNAEQISEIFDGVLTDGIIPSQGQLFDVNSANNGMQITIGTGRAWFDHTWSKNDSIMVLTVDESDITRPRYDTVVLEVNHSEDVRENSIKIVKGVAAVNADKPILLDTDTVKQYPLAHILVRAATEEIRAADIENMVGREPTVFATGVLKTVPIDDLWSQWKGEWEDWFENIKLQLSGDIVTNLQLQIDQLKESIKKLFTDETREMYGLPADSTVDDVLQILYLYSAENKSIMRVTVQDPYGEPFPNALINITKSSGNLNNIEVNEYGRSKYFITTANESVTVAFNDSYADITGSIVETASEKGVKEVILTPTTIPFVLYTSSKNIMISKICKQLDLSLCGGGGGGSYGGLSSGSLSGSGGGGGYSNIQEDVSFIPNQQYSISVASGGSGGTSAASMSEASKLNGKAGGSSSAFGYSASGGSGASTTYGGAGNNAAGSGNGNGALGVVNGNGASGAKGTGYIYSSATATANVGGGGGSGAGVSSSGGSFTYNGGSGGSPKGGAGGRIANSSIDNRTCSPGSGGSNYGGGGGGGARWLEGGGQPTGGSGGAGAVSIRFHH